MSPTSPEQLVYDARRNNSCGPLVELIPRVKLLGIECLRLGGDMVFHLLANKDNIGNPTLPVIHGGVIAGFMEYATMLHLLTFMSIPHPPKIIDLSIDYLRAGHFRDIYAQRQVWRQGQRVANIAINVWQTTQGESIAIAWAHFRVDGP